MKTKKPTLIDAQKMHKQHPETFAVPSVNDLKKIQKGNFVKICPDCEPSERFWVEVIKVEGIKITGRIDNDLLFTDHHGLSYNDVVELHHKNVYSIQE